MFMMKTKWVLREERRVMGSLEVHQSRRWPITANDYITGVETRASLKKKKRETSGLGQVSAKPTTTKYNLNARLQSV